MTNEIVHMPDATSERSHLKRNMWWTSFVISAATWITFLVLAAKMYLWPVSILVFAISVIAAMIGLRISIAAKSVNPGAPRPSFLRAVVVLIFVTLTGWIISAFIVTEQNHGSGIYDGISQWPLPLAVILYLLPVFGYGLLLQSITVRNALATFIGAVLTVLGLVFLASNAIWTMQHVL